MTWIGVTLLRFRPLSPSDAEAAAAFIRAAFAEQGAVTDPPSSSLRETTEAVARKIGDGGAIAAVDGEEIVGLVLFQPDDDALYLGRLAVSTSRRGRGIARRLLALAEQEATRQGFAKTRLRVRLDLPDNRRLFDAGGYVEVERLAHAGYDRPTFAVMEKSVGRLEGGGGTSQ